MKLFTIVKENSSRVKNKNFQTISSDIPLWEWTVSRLVSDDHELYVNTDSDKVLNQVSLMNKVYGISRSEKHIEWEKNSDKIGSPVEDMLIEFCENSSISPSEIICLFHVTSPFNDLLTIERASKYLSQGYDSVQSVKRIQDFVFTTEDEKIIPVNYNPSRVQRTQDIPPVFMSLGAFFISTKSKILEERKRLPGRTFNYELDSVGSIEIDYPSDLQLARHVANSMIKLN
jgi:N-acylneuraminate cytidylyltransferase